MKPNIYIFEIQLAKTQPMVWRIVELKSNMSLHDLHRVIQTAMGWKNAHLYSFCSNNKEKTIEYALPETAMYSELYMGNNPCNFKLNELFINVGDSIDYLYDFGDNWLHQVIFRGRKYETNLYGYPTCSAGARKCPPEDCGGIRGYSMLLDAIASKNKKLLMEYKEWLGYDFDPDGFSADKFYTFKDSLRKIK